MNYNCGAMHANILRLQYMQTNNIEKYSSFAMLADCSLNYYEWIQNGTGEFMHIPAILDYIFWRKW